VTNVDGFSVDGGQIVADLLPERSVGKNLSLSRRVEPEDGRHFVGELGFGDEAAADGIFEQDDTDLGNGK